MYIVHNLQLTLSRAAQTTTYDFASSTTIHGIAYVFDRAITVLDRIIWFLVVCCGTALAIYMSYDVWITWKSSPVLTSVSSTGLPLRNVKFPAITICSQGKYQGATPHRNNVRFFSVPKRS